jgi:hypothetical protein
MEKDRVNETILTGAIITLAAGIVGKIIWDWLKNNKNGNRTPTSCALANDKADEIFKILKRSEAIMDRMKEVHSKQDDSGRPLWYMPSKTINQIDAIDTNTKSIQSTLLRLLEEIRSTNIAILSIIKK